MFADSLFTGKFGYSGHLLYKIVHSESTHDEADCIKWKTFASELLMVMFNE